MAYRIRLDDKAEADLKNIYDRICKRSSSSALARGYVNRIVAFLSKLDVFPERGTIRSHLRPGLRIIGFERRVSIAFIVEETEVIILRILYGGQSFEDNRED